MAQVQARAVGGQTGNTKPWVAHSAKPVLAFQARPRLASKRVAAQRVYAGSNPVATVEKTLEKTASTLADTAKDVAAKVTSQPEKHDLDKVILLQGKAEHTSFPTARMCLQIYVADQ